jgi:hypothetical protein
VSANQVSFLLKVYARGTRFLNHWFEDSSPEVAIRYLPVANILKRENITNIAEIGSGATGITPYLKKQVTAVDPVLSESYAELIKPVAGSALALPFKDNEFEAVISLDMLEHIAPGDREQAIKEMFRVASRLVIVGVPSNLTSEEQDKKVDALYKEVHGEPYHFLREHLSNGLPTDEQLKKWAATSLSTYGKAANVELIKNTNLKIRFQLMKSWIKAERTNGFFFKLSNILIPLLRFTNFGTCYRTIMVAKIEQ